MTQAYNFTASWQLFPEKGIYEYGERPKSGIYKIDALPNTKQLVIYHNMVTLDNQAYGTTSTINADGELNNFIDTDQANLLHADKAQAVFPNGYTFEIHFYKKGEVVLHVVHDILPNGYLKVTRQGFKEDATAFTNSEIYHKQMSVLPYSSSVSGVVIRPTEEGVIKNKALMAMEEQTNMQLNQIRKQIELLAMQANEIQQRKELSMKIYEAKISFKPNIGQVYFLYEKKDGSFTLSMISPKEWSNGGPFKSFVSGVQLLADHTWKEM